MSTVESNSTQNFTGKSKLERLKEKALNRIRDKPKLDASTEIDLNSGSSVVPTTIVTSVSDNKVDKKLDEAIKNSKSPRRKTNWTGIQRNYAQKLKQERRNGLEERRHQFAEDNEIWQTEEASEVEEDQEEVNETETNTHKIRVNENEEIEEAVDDEEEDGSYVSGEDADDEEELEEEDVERRQLLDDEVEEEEGSDDGESDHEDSESKNEKQTSSTVPSSFDVSLLSDEASRLTCEDSEESNCALFKEPSLPCTTADTGFATLDCYSTVSCSKPQMFPESGILDILFSGFLSRLTLDQYFEVTCELTGMKEEGRSLYNILTEVEEEVIVKKPSKRKRQVDSEDESDSEEIKKTKIDDDDTFRVDDEDSRSSFTKRPSRVVIDDEEEESEDLHETEEEILTADSSLEDRKKAKSYLDELKWVDDDVDEQEESKDKGNTKLYDDEAELSGSDVGSDLDDDGEDNEYLVEDGDQENINFDEVREQNIKTMLKLQKDEDDKVVAQLQEDFHLNEDKVDNYDRRFRMRLLDNCDDLDINNLLNGEEDEQDEGGEDPVIPIQGLGKATTKQKVVNSDDIVNETTIVDEFHIDREDGSDEDEVVNVIDEEHQNPKPDFKKRNSIMYKF